MNQKQIEMAVDMGEKIICDQGVVVRTKWGKYLIKAPNGYLVGLGTEQYGLNGTNFRDANQSLGLDVAEQEAGIDRWSDENCPSDNS